MSRKLRALAKAVYGLTKEGIWLGGKGEKGPWPPAFATGGYPAWKFESKVTWSVSPEVILGEHRVRICVSWYGDLRQNHKVRVFVDDELKHPGGTYSGWNNWFGGWSWRLARQEHEEGGKTGPVGREDALLEAARVLTTGSRPDLVPKPVYCDSCFNALTEAEKNRKALAVDKSCSNSLSRE